MKLGIVADPHLEVAGTSSPSVLGFPSVPAEYERDEYVLRYRHALQQCLREDADGVVLLDDLSRFGDDETLRAGVRLAARTGRTVWTVLATTPWPGGTANRGGERSARHACRRSGWEKAANRRPLRHQPELGLHRPLGRGPDVSGWGDDLVVLRGAGRFLTTANNPSDGRVRVGGRDLTDHAGGGARCRRKRTSIR